MYLGLFEPAESRLVRELLAPGDTFVDVGAHIGWFATIAAGRVGAAGQVVAIEPYPANAAVLRDNLTRNRCRNVRVLGSAMGSTQGTLTLARGADSGGVTALDWVRDGRVEVPVTTLDEAVADVGPIALVKIDVEGWEAHVLRGAPRALARARSVLIEINPPALRKAGSSAGELSGLLAEAGFTTFRQVAEGGLRRLHRTDVVNVLATKPPAS
jgi:FkbM family methyltransferase